MQKMILAAAFLLTATVSFAQAVGPASQANQRARIRQGVATGELTRPEAARLKGREAAIRHDKRAARADGVVTRRERKDIRQEKTSASRAIYNQKHDGQVRR